MQKITPFLWFAHQAEEAVTFYTSIFKNSKIGRILRYSEEAAKASGQPPGSVLTIEFEIEGQKFVALNGGPQFKFNESISFNRKSTRLNSSHPSISYAVFCLKKKRKLDTHLGR